MASSEATEGETALHKKRVQKRLRLLDQAVVVESMGSWYKQDRKKYPEREVAVLESQEW